MAYKLRDRKNKRIIQDISSSDSDSKSNGVYSDPDYARASARRPRQRPRLNANNQDSLIQNPSPQSHGIVIREVPERPNLSWGSVTEPLGRRRGRGRPPKRKDNDEGPSRKPRQRASRRRRSSYSGFDNSLVGTYYNPFLGKRTILSWLIWLGQIKEDEVLLYLDLNRLLFFAGKVRRGGVQCKCCKRVLTVGEFERHGGGVMRQPYKNILVVESMASLMTYLIKVWHSPTELARSQQNLIVPTRNAVDSHDDACKICADGGHLICCEKCPSTFHPACMGMEKEPQEEWLCPHCVCKYCGSREGELSICAHCEKQYHSECCPWKESIDLNSSSHPFCGPTCRRVFNKLEELIGERNRLTEGYSWILLRRMDLYSDSYPAIDTHKRVECNSKIALAWDVLDSCFAPYRDRHTKIDVLQSIVYNCGSNFNRINFNRFYTAVLEKDDEILSAATIRIHGGKLAEMPFIGTRENHRQQGLGTLLLAAIESTLCDLGVEKLLLPSISETLNMWMHKYSFRPIEDETEKEITMWNTVMFPSTTRLEKVLIEGKLKKLDLNALPENL